MKFMAEWVYKEQNPDFIKKAYSDEPLTYGKPHLKTSKDDKDGKDFEPSMHSHTPRSMSRKTSQRKLSDDEFPEIERTKVMSSKTDKDRDTQILTSDEEPDEPDANLPELRHRTIGEEGQFKRRTDVHYRKAVCGEVYGVNPPRIDIDSIPKHLAKTARPRLIVEETMKQISLFKMLEPKEFDACVSAMEFVKFKKDEVVLRQGGLNRKFYVVEYGVLDGLRKHQDRADPEIMASYGPGTGFGELALLHNYPNSFSVIANDDCMMFCLDRSVYQAITREFNIARRQRFENYLSKIDILHDLTSEERTSLAEIFYCETYHAGNKAETIAYQGEPGNKLVVIDSGNATAFHTKSGKEEVVKHLKQGDYFGELSLLRNEERPNTVRPYKHDVGVCSIDREAFRRVLGPLDTILERDPVKYQKYTGRMLLPPSPEQPPRNTNNEKVEEVKE